MNTMDDHNRGFSYKPETSPEIGDLQLIEGEELERTWKTSRRDRLIQQEEKIWEQFCGEKDIVGSVCGDDPYVFVEELPESYIQELMEKELEKMKKESVKQQSDFEQDSVEMDQHTVTFADKEDTEILQIFDENVEQISDGSNSPPTVRELSPLSQRSATSPPALSTTMMTPGTPPNRSSPPTSPPQISTPPKSPRRSAPKENVRGVIESSIYCAKLKELRWKINEALMDFMDSLQCQSLCNVYPENVVKLKKHSLEFSTRFNRVYMYQLQRQLTDIKRHNSRALPYAKHTHFQAQMVRVTSLHQNILQAILVYYKCFGQSLLLNETSFQVKSLLNTIRECTELCTNIAAPNDLRAAKDLYIDDVLSTCDHVDQILVDYDKKIEAIVDTEQVSVTETAPSSRGQPRSARDRNKPVKAKSADKASRSTKQNAESKLSMYSLDKANSSINIKSSRSNTTSKLRITPVIASSQVSTNSKVEKNDKDSAKEKPKKPLRRPLMRGTRVPVSHRTPRMLPDEEVHTMVEAINDTGPTSRTASRVQSPLPQTETTRSLKSRDSTPRNGPKSRTTTPRLNSTRKSSPRSLGKNILKPSKPQEPSKLDTISSEQEVKIEGFQRESVTQTDCVVQVDGDTSLHVEKNKKSDGPIVGHDVSALLHKLCGGDGNKAKMQYSGSNKNVQLLTINSGSPRQPTTPQLLKILEETIQKKPTKHHRTDGRDLNKCLLPLAVGEPSLGALRQYRTRFVQHMLASPMYANSDVGKPWEVVGRVSEKIIDELLANCAKEMQLRQLTHEIYTNETK